MNREKNSKRFARTLAPLTLGFAAILLLGLAGCGGGSGSSGSAFVGGAQNGTVSMMMSDDPSADWSLVGVQVLSIALNPQGGGAPVVAFTAPATPAVLNLVQLDNLGELLANATVPVGTYVSATVTISANPGDVSLVASEDPDPGFAGVAGAAVASSAIQIQGAAGSKTVALAVNFVSPLVVTANTNNQLDIEFHLEDPALIYAHVTASGVVWAVNFNGPVRHHPIRSLTSFLLRDLYGSVNGVASNNLSININKDYAVEPPTNPETEITSKQMLDIQADAVNGTIYYDLDGKTHNTIFDFSSIASTLPNKFVRVAARFQSNGTLVAVRVWASSSFNTVWVNPEGKVLHVNTVANTLTLTNERDKHVTVSVDGSTQFFFRVPASAVSDTTPIGTGTAFLSNLKRGFKVHIKVKDPLASPMVADTVDIQTAEFGGTISAPSTSNFTYTPHFATALDNSAVTLPYISSTTVHGGITGFDWWNFTFPTLADSGANAVSDFVTATNGAVNFGGTVGALPAIGSSTALWGDPAAPNNWAAADAILLPTAVPLGNVATAFVSGPNTFSMTAHGGATAVTVDVSTVSGSATVVYAIDRSGGGIVTISPVDITSSGGLAAFTNAMVNGTLVKVAGIPEGSGHLKAMTIFYFTGVVPTA